MQPSHRRPLRGCGVTPDQEIRGTAGEVARKCATLNRIALRGPL